MDEALWLERIDAAIKRGDLLYAVESARRAIEEGAKSKRIKYLYVLATARSGATSWATRLYLEYGLDHETDVDSRTLWARLAKDKAFRSPDRQQDLLFEAAELYGRIYQDTEDTFPGINAATLLAMAGDRQGSKLLAKEIIKVPHIANPENYWDAATLIEGLLVVGNTELAFKFVEIAKSYAKNDYGSLSSTFRNLKALLSVLDPAGLVLEKLKRAFELPNTMIFTGHMFGQIQGSYYRGEAEIIKAIETKIDERNIKVGYGALACGADILFAEALLRKNCELHVILPLDEESLVQQSVEPGGDHWVERFYAIKEACKSDTNSFVHATQDEYVGDPRQFTFGMIYAEGMALLRSRFIGSDAIMLALWDGESANGAQTGTAMHVENWRRDGSELVVIPFQRGAPLSRFSGEVKKKQNVRTLQAMLFMDFPGFTKLSEGTLPTFWDEVMGGIHNVLKRHKSKILAQNTWGDAVHVVLESPADAAELTLAIQARLAKVDFRSLGLKYPASMRMSLHYGPVYRVKDKITNRTNFFGSQVSEAARIEPVTPAGAVYVTEAFAAALERQDFSHKFECIFVGEVELAKEFGKRRMYSLIREVQINTKQ